MALSSNVRVFSFRPSQRPEAGVLEFSFAHRSDLDTTVACYFGYSSRPLYVFYVPFQPIHPAPASHLRPRCVWTLLVHEFSTFRPWTFRTAKHVRRYAIYAFADRQPTLSRFWVAFCFRIAGTNRSGIASIRTMDEHQKHAITALDWLRKGGMKRASN